MNKDEIIERFKLSDLSPLSNTKNIIIDLISKWEDIDSYKIKINDLIREIEAYKLSKCGLIMFVDSFSNQTTILNLKNYTGKNSYIYKDKGSVLFSYSIGRSSCSLIVYDEHIELKEVKKIKSGKKSNYKTEIQKYEKNNGNIELASLKYQEIKKEMEM